MNSIKAGELIGASVNLGGRQRMIGATTAFMFWDEPPHNAGGNAHDRRKRRRLVARILRGEHRRR